MDFFEREITKTMIPPQIKTDEELANESEMSKNDYKIVTGKRYLVRRQEYGGHVFYKIEIKKRNKNNSEVVADKSINFFNPTLDCNIQDCTFIVPKKLKEDFYYSKSDTNRYHPVWVVHILDWEVVDATIGEENRAIQDYKMETSPYADELPF